MSNESVVTSDKDALTINSVIIGSIRLVGMGEYKGLHCRHLKSL